jgi:hypothetical protein
VTSQGSSGVGFCASAGSASGKWPGGSGLRLPVPVRRPMRALRRRLLRPVVVLLLGLTLAVSTFMGPVRAQSSPTPYASPTLAASPEPYPSPPVAPCPDQLSCLQESAGLSESMGGWLLAGVLMVVFLLAVLVGLALLA